MHTTTYEMMKRTIERQIAKGTLNKESTLTKLDLFLMNDRITAEEYTELLALIEDGEDNGNAE